MMKDTRLLIRLKEYVNYASTAVLGVGRTKTTID